ncbi:helicase [Clostridium phage Clo-PEP-1]|nr:helicase [Clostridium phage Clo-PEP-1]
MLKISNSRINKFLSCPYAHYVKYYEGLVPKRSGAALQRGSAIHQAIEDYHNGKSWKKSVDKFSKEFYKNTFKEEILEFGDIPKMVYSLCDNYFHYYDEKEDNVTYVENEHHFELKLCKGVNLEGYIDSVLDVDGKIWAKETKTYKKMPDRNFLIFNRQSAIYTWALLHEYPKVSGTIWDIILAQQPGRPELTQKGVLSQKRIKSTPLELERGIKELGLDPKDYESYINSARWEDFFVRHPIILSKNILNSVMDDTIEIAKLIRDEGHKRKEKNLGKGCSFCEYKSLCQAELLNLDKEFIIKADYRQREESDNGKKAKIKIK